MIETHLNPTLSNAQKIAHQERADAFKKMFRALPQIVSSLRHRS